MAKKEKVESKKVITISDLNVAIGELVNEGLVPADITTLIENGLVTAKVGTVRVEAGKFTGDYVKFSIGEKAVDDDDILASIMAICGGNLTSPVVEGEEDDDEEKADDRKPSLVKFALYGQDLNARSRTSQRIKTLAEGPNRAIERMAKDILKNKPGKYTPEQAYAKAKEILGDDEDETVGEEVGAE